jgi:hypothetical protein
MRLAFPEAGGLRYSNGFKVHHVLWQKATSLEIIPVEETPPEATKRILYDVITGNYDYPATAEQMILAVNEKDTLGRLLPKPILDIAQFGGMLSIKDTDDTPIRVIWADFSGEDCYVIVATKKLTDLQESRVCKEIDKIVAMSIGGHNAS